MEGKALKVEVEVNETTEKAAVLKRYQAYEAGMKKINDTKEK